MNVHDEVLQIANQHLTKIRRSGSDNIQAICPFHLKADGSPERKPSFRMSLSKGLYFCQSCHAKGNLFTFLRALGIHRYVIKQRYSHLLDQISKNVPPPPDPLKPLVYRLPTIEEAVLGLFDYCPTELLDEGFERRTLRHFEVGYDAWHQRITYPLRNLIGQLVGVSGRNPEGLAPKYKTYTKEYARWGLPEVSEPDKRAVLWNADRVYPELYFTSPSPSTYVVVVEGFKAAMWLWQLGNENVVALLGSYLSWEHKWILEHLGVVVYLFLDNDYAGRNGTINAADALSKSLSVRVVEYPSRLLDEEAQPDNCLPDEVTEALANAPTYLNWLLKHGQAQSG